MQVFAKFCNFLHHLLHFTCADGFSGCDTAAVIWNIMLRPLPSARIAYAAAVVASLPSEYE